MFVSAGEEHDVIALQTLIAGNGVARHGAIAVADMRLTGWIVDWRGDIKCFSFHVVSLLLFSLHISRAMTISAGKICKNILHIEVALHDITSILYSF